MATTMKLRQGQIWKHDEKFLRIVRLERLEVEYKSMTNPSTKEGTHLHATKKEFCRVLKNAALQSPAKVHRS